MASLTNTKISDTYSLLLKIESNGVDGTFRSIEDGDGTGSALQISTSGINVAGTITASGTATFNGTVDINNTSDFASVAMTIDSSGNVGIGTDNPTNSANYKTLDIRGTDGGQFLLGRSSFDFFAFSSSSITRLGTASGQDLAFHTNSSGSTNERIRITSGGNVGIGET